MLTTFIIYAQLWTSTKLWPPWLKNLYIPLFICLTYKVVQIWPGQTVTSLHTNSPGHVWTTLYSPETVFLLFFCCVFMLILCYVLCFCELFHMQLLYDRCLGCTKWIRMYVNSMTIWERFKMRRSWCPPLFCFMYISCLVSSNAV
jgi:hypothetical protein